MRKGNGEIEIILSITPRVDGANGSILDTIAGASQSNCLNIIAEVQFVGQFKQAKVVIVLR